MKKKTVGTGITKRVQFSYETPEEMYAYLERFFSGRTFDFENLILKRIEKTAWAWLHKAGLTREKLLKVAAKRKAAIDSFLLERGVDSLPDHGEDLLVIEEAMYLTRDRDDSHEGYAARWLDKIEFIRKIRDRQPDISLQTAFELGGIYTEARMKFPNDPLVELARSHKESSRKGGQARVAQMRDEKAERDREIRKHAVRLRQTHSPREFAGVLAPIYGISASRVRRILNQKPA